MLFILQIASYLMNWGLHRILLLLHGGRVGRKMHPNAAKCIQMPQHSSFVFEEIWKGSGWRMLCMGGFCQSKTKQ